MQDDNSEVKRQNYNKAFFARAGNLAPLLTHLSLEEIGVAMENRARTASRNAHFAADDQARIQRAIGKKLTRVEQAKTQSVKTSQPKRRRR